MNPPRIDFVADLAFNALDRSDSANESSVRKEDKVAYVHFKGSILKVIFARVESGHFVKPCFIRRSLNGTYAIGHVPGFGILKRLYSETSVLATAHWANCT